MKVQSNISCLNITRVNSTHDYTKSTVESRGLLGGNNSHLSNLFTHNNCGFNGVVL